MKKPTAKSARRRAPTSPPARPSGLAAIAARVADCAACPRLSPYVAGFRDREGYWGRAVPGFGDPDARLLVLGLAPGAHGANRTGRPFTGDGAGIFLYRALHETGRATRADAVARDDGLTLSDVFITNVVKCVPPENRPTPAEAARCAAHLTDELAALSRVRVVFALGRVAHEAWVRRAAPLAGIRVKDVPFVHGGVRRFGGGLPHLVSAFHPSRYNVNVGTLTYPMFLSALQSALALLDAP